MTKDELYVRLADVCFADLRDDLSYADLYDAVLYFANLCEDDMSYADLRDILLRRSDLCISLSLDYDEARD